MRRMFKNARLCHLEDDNKRNKNNSDYSLSVGPTDGGINGFQLASNSPHAHPYDVRSL